MYFAVCKWFELKWHLALSLYSVCAMSLQCDSMTAFQRKASITSSLTCECISCLSVHTRTHAHGDISSTAAVCLSLLSTNVHPAPATFFPSPRVTGGELFEDIVAREYYSEADARYEPPPTHNRNPIFFYVSACALWDMQGRGNDLRQYCNIINIIRLSGVSQGDTV